MAGKKKKKKHKAEDSSALPSRLFESISDFHFLYVRKLEKVFSAADLSAEQFRILTIIREAPSEGLSLHNIRSLLPNKTANATRLVGKLEAKGLLIKKSSGQDKREVRIKPTAEGVKVIEAVGARIGKLNTSVASGLKHKGIRELVESLGILSKELE